MSVRILVLAIALSLGIAQTAAAQDGTGDISPETAAGTDDGAGTAPLGDEQAIHEERVGTEEYHDSSDPYEDPTGEYYFLGLFYRHVFIPEFIIDLFTDESTGASNPAFGAEFTYRKGGFDIIGSLWWMGAGVEGAFRGSGDPDTETEWIDSSLSVLYISGTFLWSTEFSEMFALEYGVSLGVGLVLGSMTRTEAHRTGGDWQPCNGPGNPSSGEYCETTVAPTTPDGLCNGDGGHYCEEGKWSDGGDVPNVVPWLAIPQIALRFKPVRQFMMRIEGGFGFPGFFLGAAANYGF